ncbi:MAG: hypothetical protein PHU72_03135 [Dethiosulfovibrio sp.]|nr:hypothetical protein [Dethiosulfovibrio sp.]
MTDLTVLPVGERSLFFLICCKLLCGTASPHVYEAVTAIFECSGYRFTAKWKRVFMEGSKTFERLFHTSLKEKPEDDTGGPTGLNMICPDL